MCRRPSRSVKSTVTALIRGSSVRYRRRSSCRSSIDTRLCRWRLAWRLSSSSSEYESIRKSRRSVVIARRFALRRKNPGDIWIEGLGVAPSPDWLEARVWSAEDEPVDFPRVVDVDKDVVRAFLEDHDIADPRRRRIICELNIRSRNALERADTEIQLGCDIFKLRCRNMR